MVESQTYITLQNAARMGQIAWVSALLDAGDVNINAIDDWGFCALHHAVFRGSLELAQLLIDRGADVDTSTKMKKQTSLHISARYGKLNLMQLLKNSGSNLNNLDATIDGKAPMHLAAKHSQKEAVTWLLDNGVDVNTQTRSGLIPLYYALENENEKMMELLISRGSHVDGHPEILNGVSPLHRAAKKGNYNCVALLLQNGANPHVFCNVEKLSPAHWAVKHGNLNALRMMKEFGFDLYVRAKNKEGDGLIHLAAAKEQLHIIDWLLSNDIDINLRNNDGFTALHKAAFVGNVNSVKYLLTNGANANYRSHKPEEYTALSLAALRFKLAVVEKLLAFNADANLIDDKNYTPMHHAVMRNSVLSLKEMFKANGNMMINVGSGDGENLLITAAKHDASDVTQLLMLMKFPLTACDKNGMHPLHYAAERCSYKSAKILLDKADVNVKDREIRTPLFYAILAEKFKMVQLFLSKNAAVNIQDVKGITPLHLAARNGDVRLLNALLRKGANVFAVAGNPNGDLPIHIAALHANKVAVRWFLSKEVSVNARSRTGYTPLLYATIKAHADLITFLIHKGGDVRLATNWDNLTCLHIAAFYGHTNLIRQLLAFCADVNASTIHGRFKPLHFAAKRGHFETVKILVDSGALVVAFDENFMTPREFAEACGHTEIAQFLLTIEMLNNS